MACQLTIGKRKPDFALLFLIHVYMYTASSKFRNPIKMPYIARSKISCNYAVKAIIQTAHCLP